MTVPVEPVFIGGHSAYLKFYAMPRNADDPRRVEGTFTLVGAEGVLTLDAIVGPQGIPGEPSPIIRPQWGSSVTDPGDLPDVATLDESDDGRAWYILGQWHVYSDLINDYRVVQGSIPGPPGVTPDISITAEQVDAGGAPVYGPIPVVESGTSSAPNFHLLIPGVEGPAGPAAAIRLATDYDDTDPPDGGDAIVWDDAIEKWKPGSPTLYVPKRYTIPHNSFTSYTGGSSMTLLAALDIPAQEFDWYPDVVGHVKTQRYGLFSSAQVQIEVRIGLTGSGTGEDAPLCGLGPYDNQWSLFDTDVLCHILPHFSSTAAPDRAISPDSMEGRCLAGDAMTVYVYAHKIGGSGSYQAWKTNAQLRIDVTPVSD